jgi:hypothetical protein
MFSKMTWFAWTKRHSISLRGIDTEVQTEADELAHCGNPLPKEAYFVCVAMPPAGPQTPGTQ